MRLRTLVVWVIILGLVAWAGYTIVLAGSSYLAVAGVVDQAVSDAMGHKKTQTGAGMVQERSREFMAAIRANIVAGAQARGVDLPLEGVAVSEAAEGIRVYAGWSFPVVVYDDVVAFNVPLSVTRSYAAQ